MLGLGCEGARGCSNRLGDKVQGSVNSVHEPGRICCVVVVGGDSDSWGCRALGGYSTD